jgi:hypothetical protein
MEEIFKMKIRVQYCGFHFFNHEIPSSCELCKKNNFGIAFDVFFRRRRTAGKWLYPKEDSERNGNGWLLTSDNNSSI